MNWKELDENGKIIRAGTADAKTVENWIKHRQKEAYEYLGTNGIDHVIYEIEIIHNDRENDMIFTNYSLTHAEFEAKVSEIYKEYGPDIYIGAFHRRP